MIGIETVRHQLALAVRIDDHFAMAPASRELAVTLDSKEPATRTVDDRGTRNVDNWISLREEVGARCPSQGSGS